MPAGAIASCAAGRGADFCPFPSSDDEFVADIEATAFVRLGAFGCAAKQSPRVAQVFKTSGVVLFPAEIR